MANVIKDFVIETSTTTGTGSLTLSGTLYGLRTFANVCTVGDTVRYIIKAVNESGIPTGEWEIVEGSYSAANTLTRVTVIDSSNSGSLVNFSAGTKHVYMGGDAVRASWGREKLSTDRTYYVRTDGSDSNNGLANTSGGAFLTIQKAIDTIADTLDCNRKTLTVQVANGTYTGSVAMRPLVGGNAITVQGNSGTPANVVISTTSASAFSNAYGGTLLTVKDLKITTTTSGSGLVTSSNGVIYFTNLDFGACASFHISAQGGRVLATGNYAISGAAQVHWFSNGYGSLSCVGRTITITGTPAFSSYFSGCNTPGVIEVNSNTFSGSATGKRYDVSNNGVIFTNGGGATYLPGDVAGTTATGGQYV